MRINFRFRLLVKWSSPHGSGASSHIIWCKIALSSAKLLIFFSEIQDGGRRHLGFSVYVIWPFRRVGSVVFVLCSKFGSNICYSHWDRRTYTSDIYLMTSCELTSGFDFWSSGHLRMAMLHLPYNLMQDIFIQSKVIDIFPKLKMAAEWVSHGTTHEASFVVRISCKHFVMIR